MKYLKKITISNARRFAKDICIDFGEGATILLAPNGTGKTTVFESIEFALTGAIQRLDRPPLVLIRDNEIGVDIRLDFEDDLFCEVNYRKGHEPVLNGHHDVIFPNRKIDEIPYLIRLTHLLEQRGANWFVQQPNSSEAGQLLDKLSIGKELNKIFSSKASATRSANAALDNAEFSLKLNKEKLERFNKLISARSSAKTDFTLQSLSELILEIIRIHALFSETKPELEEKLSTIISFTAQTASQLTSKLEANSENTIKLAKMEEFIEEYLYNQQKLVKGETQIKKSALSIDKGNKELKKINEEIKQKSIANNEVKIEHGSLIGLRHCFSKIEATTLQIKHTEKEIADTNLLIPITKEKIENIGNQIEIAQTKKNRHKLLAEQEETLSKTKAEIKTKELLIAEWADLVFRIETITNSTLPSLKTEGNRLASELSTMKVEVEKLEKDFTKNQDLVDKLKNASDSISSAVSMIANNLPQDKDECPVCNAKYSPHELQNRITKAVSYIDPLLNNAIAENKVAKEELSTFKNKYVNLLEQVNIINNEIDVLSKQKRTYESTINENIIPKFPSGKDRKEAKKWLDKEITNIEKSIATTRLEKSQLGDIIGFEKMESLILMQQKHKREISHLNESLQNSLQKQSIFSEELKNLVEQIGSNTIEGIRASILEIEGLVSQNLTDLEKLKQSESLTQRTIRKSIEEVTNENNKNTKIKGKQNEILAEWNEVNLPGEPNINTLNERKNQLSDEKNTLTVAKQANIKVEEELAKWKIAQEYEKYNSEIKALCGSLNEDDYLKNLSTLVDDSQEGYLQIKEKIKTLRNLYSKIGEELDTTHGYLQEINPSWKALLRRVVVNPRFAETSLNSYNYRNKPQAEVNVKMHGSPMKVIDVASEAQITDIQLTFMLAMANTYEWTPWKGLLLDDPTQHHDLVHSSSVFDLLRDYIIDKKYQILLGTHDSIHANFFKRKLDNDGVPVKIWNLTSDNDGVKAIQM